MMKELVLVIGGSDSSGGAGIQADIKSITVHGAYAASAITSITSQNTQGVQEIFDLPTDLIVSQIDSVISESTLHYQDEFCSARTDFLVLPLNL